ncbi:NAD(P)H-dependent amine dehydrogenase family protein [Phenylobacterium conjunctum]|uniref:Dihydrodipicolinate reductase N-terminal domain-containing protein n=1 Tax=Phenylobacterium conjunctum TaxID=1298959 RepID=A0ABW3T034_9CAUL
MTYRVVQWATGAMGKNCLRAVIDHPAMQLVGLYVYGDDKAGRDAGDIARRPPTGVIATRDIDEILALDADVVIHCARLAPPYGSHDAEILKLLASGKNVISINGYSKPSHAEPQRLAALEAACRQGGSTLMAAGLNPGFAGEQLAVVASGVCQQLDHIEVVESVDCRPVRNPDYVFKILGFGSDPQTVNPNDPAWGPASSLNGMYTEVLAAMAEHLNLPLERVETDHRVFPATEPLSIAAGAIAEGAISHINWRWRGIVAGQTRLTMSIQWYMETAHLPDPHPSLWTIHIEGQPGVRLAVELEKRKGDTSPTSAEQIAVAGSVLNAIPVVTAAAPGLLTRPLATPFRGDLL